MNLYQAFLITPFKRAAAGLCLSLLVSSAGVWAQSDYPNKPITILVGYPPGGQGDVFARIIGERLGARLGQPVVVENRPGGSGALASRQVARAKADGYTLLLGQGGEMAVNQFVVKNLGYDTLRDFKPVVLIGNGALVLSAPVNTATPSLADLLKFAKSKPGQVTYASSGTATPGHLAAAALGLGTKTEMTHIPYKGGGQALTDLLGGQVSVFFSSAAAVMPHLKSGKLVALAVSTPTRMASLPQVPTVAEGTIPGFSYSLWGGLFAPVETPDAVVQKLNREVNEILQEPAIRARWDTDGNTVARNSSAEFTEYVKREITKFEGLVKTLAIQAE